MHRKVTFVCVLQGVGWFMNGSLSLYVTVILLGVDVFSLHHSVTASSDLLLLKVTTFLNKYLTLLLIMIEIILLLCYCYIRSYDIVNISQSFRLTGLVHQSTFGL